MKNGRQDRIAETLTELNIECQPRGGFVVWVKLRK